MSSSASSEDDGSLDHDDTRRKRKRKERSSRKKDRKKKKKRKRQYDSSASDSSSDDDGRRKRKKDRKKKHKKKRKDDESANDHQKSTNDDRNHVLMTSLVNLLTECPAMGDDLSTILIRLAGGTSFDLSQMTDRAAALGLSRVFESLQPFGVELDSNGAWQWQAPGGSRNQATNPLVLVRVVRAMMDQAGITMEAIQEYENPTAGTSSPVAAAASITTASPSKLSSSDTAQQPPEHAVSTHHLPQQAAIRDLLTTFGAKNDKLADELIGLVQIMLDDGETVSLEGLPDADLRNALETLFSSCGLELVEMDESDDDESENDQKQESPTMGYALPDESSSQPYETVKARLASVLTVCRRAAAGEPLDDIPPTATVERKAAAPRVVVKGPTLPSALTSHATAAAVVDSDDEEPAGPLPFAKQRGPQLPPELLKQRAARRALELANAKKGISTAPEDASGREEWMLVPGKYDFMNSNAANPLKSRQFNNPKNRGGGAGPASADEVDDSIKREIDSIRQSYETSRGPSLLEQHQVAKKESAAVAQKSGKKESWKWNRDKDLDDGRRVDKNALNMVLGNAGKELKSKFQGGY